MLSRHQFLIPLSIQTKKSWFVCRGNPIKSVKCKLKLVYINSQCLLFFISCFGFYSSALHLIRIYFFVIPDINRKIRYSILKLDILKHLLPTFFEMKKLLLVRKFSEKIKSNTIFQPFLVSFELKSKVSAVSGKYEILYLQLIMFCSGLKQK